MGKHVLEKPTLSQRLFPRAHAFWAGHSSVLPMLNRRTVRFGWGFFAVVAWSLVSVVDPYSGTMVSASASMIFNANDPTQSYGLASTQQISFARGGFNVVTGSDASALFVSNADLPAPGTSKQFALQQLLDMGYGSEQYSCLVTLWNRESNWRVNAVNSSSGAYGIPQALPGAKMASAGEDWLINPETQIRWGLSYIKGRYGSPCGALAHSNKFGWY
ncbi:MAG: lytic transglycosylase domain-containing protein [Micrococcales bacterium]